MSLNQLLKSLRREFPKMRFYRNKLWNKDVIRSNYGDNKFITVRILPNNQFRIGLQYVIGQDFLYFINIDRFGELFGDAWVLFAGNPDFQFRF